MRAEDMTVGLELCTLENLRIFNGYEVTKKERKLSIPSSPEDNGTGKDAEDEKTTTKEQHSPRPKCGRPSNPIPRHKRDSHIRAEYKRRDKIQKGFETLSNMVPDLTSPISSKDSKSSVLFKTAEYCRGLKADCGQSQSEAATLRLELEALGSEIHKLQELLPDHGMKDVTKPIPDLDAMYDEYVKEETNKNWKFWIFSFFMRPLFKSYRSVMSGKMNQFEFAQATNEWVTESLSLASLRKGFLETFRKFSTQTSILTDPSKLEEEAYRSVGITKKIKSAPPSPVQEVPRSPVPLTTWAPTCTSSFTPMTTTSQLVPDLKAAISKGMIAHRSKQPMSPPESTEVPRSSRSRSSTPPPAVVKQRRRSRSRSEANRTRILSQGQQQDAKGQPMDVTMDQPSTLSNNNSKILRLILNNKMPVSNADSYCSSNTSVGSAPFNVDNLVNNTNPSPTLSAQAWPPVSMMSESSFVASTAPVVCSGNNYTTSYNTNQSSAFLPLDSSASISNGQIVHYNQQHSTDSHSLMSDISFAMDVTVSQSDSYDLDNLNVFTTAQSTVTSPHSPLHTSHNSFTSEDHHLSPVKQEMFNHDEDSLTGMLNIDLMDVNSVLTFLDQDHVIPNSSENSVIP